MIIRMAEEVIITINKAKLKKGIRTASFVGVAAFLYADDIVNIVAEYKKYESRVEISNIIISGFWSGCKLARRVAKQNDLEIKDVISASLARLVGVI